MVVNSLAALQAQNQAQAQALQAALNNSAAAAGAQASQQRNTGLWNMQGVSNQSMLQGGFNAANFYTPQMQAAAAAVQESNLALVAVAKLSTNKSNPKSNSPLVVRTSVRKFNLTGGVFSVAQWTRKTLEENLDWLVKLARRHCPDENAVLLAYGDGCESLLLIDDHTNKMPDDFSKIKKIGVGCSMVDINNSGEENQLMKFGVLQANDTMWDHVKFETLEKKEKTEKCLFIHTNVSIWSDSVDGRRRVLQVVTGGKKNPFHAVTYKPNPVFEQNALAKWKGLTQIASPFTQPFVPSAAAVAAATAASLAASAKKPAPEPETIIAFNAKELLLLEKAFDNCMNSRDLKSKADKPTEEDKRKCQTTIRRAKSEFTLVKTAPRKRKKKADTEKGDGNHSSPTKKPAAKPAAKKVKEEKEKSDDEPAKKKAKEEPSSEDEPTNEKAKDEKSDEPKKKTPAKKEKESPKKKKAEVKKDEPRDSDDTDSDSDSDNEPISKLKPKAAPARRASASSKKAPVKPGRRSSKAVKAEPESKKPPARRRSSTRKK